MTVNIIMDNFEQVSLLCVQSNLMPLLILHMTVTIAQVAMSVSTAVAADWLAASDILSQECIAH